MFIHEDMQYDTVRYATPDANGLRLRAEKGFHTKTTSHPYEYIQTEWQCVLFHKVVLPP